MSLFGNGGQPAVVAGLIDVEMARIIADFGLIWKSLIETRKEALTDSGLYNDLILAPVMASRYWLNRVNRDGFGPAPEFITPEISSYIHEVLFLTLFHNGVTQPATVSDKIYSCLLESIQQIFNNSPAWFGNRRLVLEIALLLSLNIPSEPVEDRPDEQ